jgi:hypothetical protein
MWIEMLETHRGSEDGHNQRRFEKNVRYNMADSLARSFLRAGWCIRTSAPLSEDAIFTFFQSRDPMEQLRELNEATARQMARDSL